MPRGSHADRCDGQTTSKAPLARHSLVGTGTSRRTLDASQNAFDLPTPYPIGAVLADETSRCVTRPRRRAWPLIDGLICAEAGLHSAYPLTMSIETKVVADFCARLYPWIDHSRDVRLCKDDGGVGAAAAPDLSFYFLEGKEELRLEFKTFYKKKGGVIGCTVKQIATWKTPGVAPHLWVAVESPSSFLFWGHDDRDFQQDFTSAPRTSKTHHDVRVPNKTRLSFTATFMRIMDYAHTRRMLD